MSLFVPFSFASEDLTADFADGSDGEGEARCRLREGAQEDVALGVVDGQLHAGFAFQILREGDAVDEVFAAVRRGVVTFALEAAGAVRVAIEEKSLEIHGSFTQESLLDAGMASPWAGFGGVSIRGLRICGGCLHWRPL